MTRTTSTSRSVSRLFFADLPRVSPSTRGQGEVLKVSTARSHLTSPQFLCVVEGEAANINTETSAHFDFVNVPSYELSRGQLICPDSASSHILVDLSCGVSLCASTSLRTVSMLEQWQCSQHRMRAVRRRIYAAHLTVCRGIIEQLEQVEIDAFPTAFVTD